MNCWLIPMLGNVRVSFMVMGGLGAETESLVGDMEVDMVV